ncbi:hypothetical protein [Modestobacter italicus]|uniref:hypothetical protein n=1 Tax=Modestobacter italicus (strain DSM 44449 / CECT 9708 / BC 501) TaxID=2732864 RepID=UPI001C95D04A|nr:hypothetical protein [Modestobacter italicus]
MTEEENRAAGNLLVLCIPHSYEIDEHEEQYPAELLQEWRVAQRKEHERIRKNWPLTEAEVDEVASSSFDQSEHRARAMADAVRAGERLALAVEASRGPVAAQAGAWLDLWDRYRRRPVGYDLDGNLAYANPPRSEMEQHKAALLAALGSAQASTGPILTDLKTEIAVVAAQAPDAAPWCDWLVRAGQEAFEATGKWPGPPPATDSDALSDAVRELRRAAQTLAAKLRGDVAVKEPPAPPIAEPPPPPDEATDALRRHEELLERAGPFARVDHRPYDAELAEELAVAAEAAAGIPPIRSAASIDLRETARLAAAVARNASDSDLLQLVERHRVVRPICVAVHLLRALHFLAQKRALPELEAAIRTALTAELASLDWTEPNTWSGNENYGTDVFALEASLTSGEAVSAKLSQMLVQAPERLGDLLLSCARWSELLDEAGQTTGFQRRYRELSAWFPREALTRAAAAEYPNVAPAADSHDDRLTDEVERLLSQVLRLLRPTSNTL